MESLRNGRLSTAQSVDSMCRASVANMEPRKAIENRFLNGFKCPSEQAELHSLHSRKPVKLRIDMMRFVSQEDDSNGVERDQYQRNRLKSCCDTNNKRLLCIYYVPGILQTFTKVILTITLFGRYYNDSLLYINEETEAQRHYITWVDHSARSGRIRIPS